jgi:hypothetical protein
MRVITGKTPNGYALTTGSNGDGRPKLTKLEQAIQGQMVVAEMLRGKGGLSHTPGAFLKNDDEVASAPHSTVEKNNSQDSPLSGALRAAKQAPTDEPEKSVEIST